MQPFGLDIKIEFYEAHISPWTTNAAGIGLMPASATALGTVRTMSASRRRPASRFQPGMAAMQVVEKEI